MKRNWILLGAVALPLVLFVSLGRSQNKTLSRVGLIAKCPDGTATLDWSRDGKFVRVDPMDKRRELLWHTAYFEAKTGRRILLDSLKMQRLFGKAPFYIGFDAHQNREPLSICSAATGACVPMRHQPSELHRMVLNFHEQRFYQPTHNGREIVVIYKGEILHWSTRTGALIQRVRFVPLKASEADFPPVLSQDGKYFIAQSDGKTALYDARTGRVRFVLPLPDEDVDFGFSPSGRVFYSTVPDDEQKHSIQVFKSVSNGRTLWKTFSPMFTSNFSPTRNLIALEGAKGLELHDVLTGKVKQRINGPKGAVNLAFSPDGRTIWSSQQLDENGDSPIWSWRVR